MQNKLFFPQAALDEWGIEGKIDLSGSELIVLADGRRYKVEEAVRVVAEVTGGAESHELVGKVKLRRALDEIGAEILENSMVLGENAYDVVPGWMGVPATPFADHVLSPERMKARGNKTDVGKALSSDEELLERFLAGTL